jgi:hypothetical protein
VLYRFWAGSKTLNSGEDFVRTIFDAASHPGLCWESPLQRERDEIAGKNGQRAIPV